jgi:tetratricopeptide (TPR) repeat protein
MADEWHISAELFRRFLDNRVAPAERRQVVRHLLGDCTRCTALVARIADEGAYWFPSQAAADSEAQDFGPTFRAAARFADRAARRLAVERLLGWGQWSALAPLLPEERLAVVLAHRKYRHWGLYRALLDAARALSFRDAREAVNVVRLALDVAELLDAAAAGGPAAAADLRAHGYAALANARRLASDLEGARVALNEAWRFNEEGTGDPLEKAQLISFDASWMRMMGHFETAEAALGEALEIYKVAGDAHMQGRTLLQMGDVIGYADPEKGIVHLRAALELINPARELRLELCAQHDLVHYLALAGRPQEALAVLDHALPLYDQFPDSWTQLRLHWVQARIARGLNHLPEAVAIFRRLWEEFHARTLCYDLVMVSLDLAEALAASREIASAARLVSEVHPVLAEWRLDRHIVDAWRVLQQALDEGRTTREIVRLFSRLSIYYRRHWHNPAEFSAD